jgi:hypothetical protein
MNTFYKIILGAIVIMPALLFSSMTAIPVTTVFAFSDNTSPSQSCSPPGLEHSSTGQNPNCFGGRIPNCVSNGNAEGSSGCENQAHVQSLKQVVDHSSLLHHVPDLSNRQEN